MATSITYLSGSCEWAKLNPDNYDQKFDKYVITLIMDKDSMKTFKGLKLKNSVRIDDEGVVRVQFGRPLRKEIKGEMIEFGPPTLYDKDGNEMIGDRPLIGNGSEVTIKISTFETKMGNGSRLEAVKINKLIVFEATPPVKLGVPVEGLPF